VLAKIFFNTKAHVRAFTYTRTHRHTQYMCIPIQNLNQVSAAPLWIDEGRIWIPVWTNAGTGLLAARWSS